MNNRWVYRNGRYYEWILPYVVNGVDQWVLFRYSEVVSHDSDGYILTVF